MHRSVYKEGLPTATTSWLNDRVLERMSSFCEMCCESHVPDKGYVVWFVKPYKGKYSACRECLDQIPIDLEVEMSSRLAYAREGGFEWNEKTISGITILNL